MDSLRSIMRSLARIQRNPRGKAWDRRNLARLLGQDVWSDNVVSNARWYLLEQHYDVLALRKAGYFLRLVNVIRKIRFHLACLDTEEV